MAVNSNNKHVPLLGQLYDILTTLKSNIQTALNNRKTKNSSSWSNSSSSKTLQTVTGISLNSNGDINNITVENISTVTEPPSSGSKISATQGLVKLQDTVNTNRTNAVTPNAVKAAIDGLPVPDVQLKDYGSSTVSVSRLLFDADDPDNYIRVTAGNKLVGYTVNGPYKDLLDSGINDGSGLGSPNTPLYIDNNGFFQEANPALIDITNMSAEEAGPYCDLSNDVLPYIVHDNTRLYFIGIDGTGHGGQGGSSSTTNYRFQGTKFIDNLTYVKYLTRYQFTPSGSSTPTSTSYSWGETTYEFFSKFGRNTINPVKHAYKTTGDKGWDFTIPTNSLKNYCENYIYLPSISGMTGQFCGALVWDISNDGGDGPHHTNLPTLHNQGQYYDFTVLVVNDTGGSVSIPNLSHSLAGVNLGLRGDAAYNAIIENGYSKLITVRGHASVGENLL